MEQITDVKTTEMNLMPSAGSKRYWWKAIASFLMVLFTMPFGACTDDYHGTCHE